MFNRGKGWLPSLLMKPKNPHSLEHLKYLYNVLCKNQTVTEQNRGLLIETLKCIAEILIWGDQNDSSVFDFFLEKNMLTFFLRYMRQKHGRYICIQLLQLLNILFQNINNETSLYYLLSNNHINSIIVHKFDFSQEEVMAYYISFLKTLSLKLNKHTIHFFYNEHTNDFALYTEAIKFFKHSEGMVRIAVRTITLNVYRVYDGAMLRYIRDRTAAPYFSNLVWFVGSHIIDLDICVRNDNDHQNRGRLETLVAEHLDHLHYVNDILCLNIDSLNDVLSDQLLNRLLIPLYVYSLTKRKRHDIQTNISSKKHVSSVVSLFLLSQVFLIIHHSPLVRQLAELIFQGEIEWRNEPMTDSPRMPIREFAAPDETLEETLGSTRGLRPRNLSVRVLEGNSTFYRRSEVPGEDITEVDTTRGPDEVIDETVHVPLQNSTDEEKIMSTRSQSGRIEAGSISPTQHSFSLENRPYLEAIFHALECTENDYEALFALCLLYAMGHNDGINQGLMDSVFMPTDRSEAKDNYNVALVERLIRIITLVTQHGSKVRLSTLELSIRLLKQLVYTPSKSYLQDRHLASIENARECSTQLLRNFYKSEEIFLDMFEDEYNEMKSRPLNVEYLTMDASILLPPTGTPLTGIDFNKRLPCGEVERARRAIRVFCLVRDLSLSLLQLEETQLPLTKDQDCVKIDNVLDLNNSDLIACTVVTTEKKQKRFLVIDALQMILVEPDIRRLGWGIVTFVGLLQNIEVTGDKEDSRSLHITVHKPATSLHARPVPHLAARFIFDDHIRCMAAKQRLTKGRMKARQLKMQMIERLLDIPAESASHGTFSRLGPIPGRSHPVRVSASTIERKPQSIATTQSVSRLRVQSSGQSSTSSSGQVPTSVSEPPMERSESIYVEQGKESSSTVPATTTETDDTETVDEVEVAEEVAEETTSEMAFQSLHHTINETSNRYDSSSHECSPAPQEIPLEDMSRKTRSKRKEQLTRAKLTKTRLAAELRMQQDHTRSESQSPKRKASSDSSVSKVKPRERSTSLKTHDSRSRSGTPERRTHSESSPLSSSSNSSLSYKLKNKSKEIQTQNDTPSARADSNKSCTSIKPDSYLTDSSSPKTLQPAQIPALSLVPQTDCVFDSSTGGSPKLLPLVDKDRMRSYSDISETSSENDMSSLGSNKSSDSLSLPNLGLDVPTGAGAELSPASGKVERLMVYSKSRGATASDRLTQLAQMVQQYNFENESHTREETTDMDEGT